MNIKNIGPGIITAALVFGPGSLTINTKLGAGFGFQLLWAIPLSILFMIIYTAMSARIGLVLEQSFIQEIRVRYGRFLSLVIGLDVFLITASFQAGNAIGAGVAFGELFHTSTTPWVIFFSVLAISLLFFRSFYKILETVMIFLVLLMCAAFLLTVIISRPNLGAILMGLIPTLPQGAEYLTVALMASSFAVGGAFYQSYLVREKNWKRAEAAEAVGESRNGIIILGFLSMLVMICAGAVLYEQQKAANAPADLGLALEPLFGRFTSSVFMVGFFAASFSSLLGNATIGGSILADTFSLGHQLNRLPARLMIVLVIVLGATVAITFGRLPLELIVLASGVTAIVAPAAALSIFLFARSEKIMGNLKNSGLVNVLGVIGLVVLLVLIVYNIRYLLGV
jgi:Mn2+/Fe2+ NRAMP family transporter